MKHCGLLIVLAIAGLHNCEVKCLLEVAASASMLLLACYVLNLRSQGMVEGEGKYLRLVGV